MAVKKVINSEETTIEVIKPEETKVETNNKKVKESYESCTKRISEAISGSIKNSYAIAWNLWKIDIQKLYIVGEFSDTYEYAEKVFGLKRASVNNYIRVANRFLKLDDKKKIVCKLFNAANEIDITQTYKITTLTELLCLDDEIVEQITNDGIVRSTMDQKEVREVVKTYKKPKKQKKIESKETDEAEIDTTKETIEPTEEHIEQTDQVGRNDDTELLKAFEEVKEIATELENERLKNLIDFIMFRTGYNF